MPLRHPVLSVLALALLAGACPPPPGEPGERWEAQLTWEPCPPHYLDACASVDVPLDWNHPGGARTPVFLARRLASLPARANLWLLADGPGRPGADLVELVQSLQPLVPDLDVYLVDYRGTGHSARLECTGTGGSGLSVEQGTACAQELRQHRGQELEFFTTTSAAQDLGHLVPAAQTPDLPVYFYGVGHGAAVAMRYLQLFPDQPAALVLDSLHTPRFTARQLDAWPDLVGQDLADFCAVDRTCSRKLGNLPWQRLQDISTLVSQGHCPQAFPSGDARAALRRSLANLLLEPVGRAVAFALLYRLERCAPADVDAVHHALDALVPPDPWPELASTPLRLHVQLSEQWPQPSPAPADLAAQVDASVFSWAVGPLLGALASVWPVAGPDRWAGTWPETHLPVLLLQGTLDPVAHHDAAAEAATHFAAETQQYVLVPAAGHPVVQQSPVRTPGAPSCGLQLLAAFLQDPVQPVSLACLDDLAPTVFAPDADVARAVMGADDLWEN